MFPCVLLSPIEYGMGAVFDEWREFTRVVKKGNRQDMAPAVARGNRGLIPMTFMTTALSEKTFSFGVAKYLPLGAVVAALAALPMAPAQATNGMVPHGNGAAVLMVSALNGGDTLVTVAPGPIGKGDELGQFGFGSTAIVLTPKSGPPIPELRRETAGKMGQPIELIGTSVSDTR